MNKIYEKYENYLKTHNIKKSSQREIILSKFIQKKNHISAQDLYNIVQIDNKEIGIATVYRAMKFFCEAGIAKEIDIGDGVKRYEINIDNKHHDHLICIKCGAIIEIYNESLEKIQNEICKKYGFIPEQHVLYVYGICKNCR